MGNTEDKWNLLHFVHKREKEKNLFWKKIATKNKKTQKPRLFLTQNSQFPVSNQTGPI